jgi:hypothetical protein
MKYVMLGIILLIAGVAKAAGPPALVCYSGAANGGVAVPLPITSCPQAQWHTPSAGQGVQTQAGTWIAFSSTGTVSIDVCTQPGIGIGKLQSACPAANQVFQLPCTAIGQTCKTPPPVTPPQAFPSTAVLSWTAPTTNTDGSAITGALTYNLYRGTSATVLTKMTTVTGLTFTDHAGSASPVTYFYAVSAVEAGQESKESNTVTVTLAAATLTPSAPTNVTLTAQ